MALDNQDGISQPSRLLPCFLNAAEDGLAHDAVMLCEVIGDEIQSISLRVAADALTRWQESFKTLRPEQI